MTKMGIASLIERLTSRKQSAIKDYAGLVSAAADGDEFDPIKAEKIMFAAGKTLDHLQADAELLSQRREWREQIDHAEQLKAEAAKADEAIRQAARERDAVVKAAEAKLKAIAEPAQAAIERARTANNIADAARNRLRETVPNAAEFESREDELREQVRAIKRQHNAVLGQMDAHAEGIAVERRLLLHAMFDGEREHHESEIARLERATEELRARLVELEEQRLAVHAAQADLSEEKLNP